MVYMKTRVQHTIETDLFRRLDVYLENRNKILGGRRSRSSVIEEALESHLVKLERELHGIKEKDIAVVRI